MWQHLSEAQLTQYQTELERCQIKVYVMALADFYHEFCRIACEEPHDRDYVEWADALELPSFRIGQLMGADVNFEPEETHNQELIEAGLSCLIQRARTRILPVLGQSAGGALGILQSLYCCSNDQYEDDTSIKNTHVGLSDKNMGIYAWLEEEIPASRARSNKALQREPEQPASVSAEDVQLSLIKSDLTITDDIS